MLFRSGFLARPEFVRGVALLGRFDLRYDLLVYERQLPAAIELARRLPGQPFVLDHVAKPRIKAGELSPWRERIQAGLVPVAVGLMFAAAWLVASGADHSPFAWAATGIACLLMLFTSLNPLWLVAAGAAAGIAGIL